MARKREKQAATRARRRGESVNAVELEHRPADRRRQRFGVLAAIIAPQTIPKITDAARATREPELAVLSALAHARRNTPDRAPHHLAVITGLSRLRNGKKRPLYLLSVQTALSAALRKALEMTPDLRKFLTASQRRAYDKAQARGEVEGRTKTKAEAC